MVVRVPRRLRQPDQRPQLDALCRKKYGAAYMLFSYGLDGVADFIVVKQQGRDTALTILDEKEPEQC